MQQLRSIWRHRPNPNVIDLNGPPDIGLAEYRERMSQARAASVAGNLAKSAVRSLGYSAARRAGKWLADRLLWGRRFNSSFTRYRRYPSRSVRNAVRRSRRQIRRALNRFRRNRRRRLRNRRRARRHARNGFTNKRERNRRSIRSFRIRRFRAGGYRRHVDVRRINWWYSIGKWYLLGGGNGIISDTASTYTIGSSYVPNNDNSSTNVGSSTHAMIPLMFNGKYALSGPHFNIYETNTTASSSTYIARQPFLGESETSITRVAVTCGASLWYWSISGCGTHTSTKDTEDYTTAAAVMPPVPWKSLNYYLDQNNDYAFGASFGGTSTSTLIRRLPYRCACHKVFFTWSYSIKVSWPNTWGNLSVSATAGAAIPPNPPFYLRMFGVKSKYAEPITYDNFIANVFSYGSRITSKVTSVASKNLLRNYGAYIFMDKLWMFNGRMIPQYQTAEVLQDGEESTFTVRVPYGFYNQPMSVASDQTTIAWAGTRQLGEIAWYFFWAFDMPPQYVSTVETAASRASWRPSFSFSFTPTVFCYPRLCEPMTPNYSGGTGTAFADSMRLTAVSKPVESSALSASPAPEASVSGLSAATSFSSSTSSSAAVLSSE